MGVLRPARQARLLVLAACGLAACSGSPTEMNVDALPGDRIPAEASTGLRVELTPATVSLAGGASKQFSAVGKTPDGKSWSIRIVWKATGGTISSTGLYKAPTTNGTYRVIATREGDVLADTSVVTVGSGGTTTPPTTGTLKVDLTPATATLAPGASQQFTAVGRYSNGSSTSLRIDWRATGGTVSSTGLYRAPSTAGTYRVIAQRSGDVLADTAIVTVGGSGGGTGSGLVGECQRARPEWIWCDDFEQDRLSRYFEVQQLSSGRFTRQNGVGNGGSYGMRSIFNTTPQTSAGSLMLAFGRTPQAYFRPVDAGTKNYREVYFRVYVKHPANWQGGGGEKLMRATSFVSSSSWAQSMIAHVWSGGDAPNDQYLYIDPASGTDAAGTVRTKTYNDFANLRWLGHGKGATPLFAQSQRGIWQCVEAHAKLNDPGQSNGLFELWVNGKLDATRSGLNWVGSYTAYGINAVFVENYWNKGSPVVQERYFDNFVVSTARIGCGS